jgi:hypothetical protein
LKFQANIDAQLSQVQLEDLERQIVVNDDCYLAVCLTLVTRNQAPDGCQELRRDTR